MYDSLVINELKSQVKSTMIYLVFPLIALVVIPLYYEYIGPHIMSLLEALNNELLKRFIFFIAMYLFLMGVLQGIRIVIVKKIKQPPRQLYIPRSFIVYRTGLVIDGRFLEYDKDMCIEENRDRRFVEIHSKKLPYVIRLYTLEISKLLSRIREAGLSECRERTT